MVQQQISINEIIQKHEDNFEVISKIVEDLLIRVDALEKRIKE